MNAADEHGATSMPEAEANIATIRDKQKDSMSLQTDDQKIKKCKVTDSEGLISPKRSRVLAIRPAKVRNSAVHEGG